MLSNYFFSSISMCYSYPCPPYLQQIVLVFFLQSIFCLLLYCFLEFFKVNYFLVCYSSTFLIATSNGSILFLTYQIMPFSSLFTLFSHPISPFHHFSQKHTTVTSRLGCNSLVIVINFLVFLSISCSSFLFHLSIPAPYLKMETAQLFSAIILFLPFSLLFKTSFALLK